MFIDDEYINENHIVQVKYNIIEDISEASKIYKKSKFKLFSDKEGEMREFLYREGRWISGDSYIADTENKNNIRLNDLKNTEYLGEVYKNESKIEIVLFLSNGNTKTFNIYEWKESSIFNKDSFDFSKSSSGIRRPDSVDISWIMKEIYNKDIIPMKEKKKI